MAKLLALVRSANEFHLDVTRQSQARSFGNRAKLIDRHVIQRSIIFYSGHLPLQCLRSEAIVRQVVSLPDPCRFLEVKRVATDLVVAVGLGLLQVAFLEQLFDQEEKHARIAREQILNLVQRHVLGVTWRFKGAFNKVVRARD